MKPWPWFGKSRARDAFHALSGALPEDPGWLDGERVEEAMVKAEECAACTRHVESESLASGRVRLVLEFCTEHVQLAARRTLAKEYGKLSEGVREKLER